MTKTLPKTNSSKILSTVNEEHGFHFYLAEGVNTKVTATSLSDFAEILNSVDAGSILFHYLRGDFQTWIRDVVGDDELADRICLVSPNLAQEELGKELQKIVKKRINELKGQPYGMSEESF